jgi:hypothetical protein
MGKTKVINNKVYHRQITKSTKHDAVLKAKELRNSVQGLRCRVVKESGPDGYEYGIYTR